MDEIHSHSPKPKPARLTGVRLLRKTLIVGCAGYLSALALYLILRTLTRDHYWWVALAGDFAIFLFIPLPLVTLLTLCLRARVWLALSLLHSLVAGLWWGPCFLPKAKAQLNGEPLRVVSFNVWGDNQRLQEVEAWLRETHADVVLLQEIPFAYADHTIPALADVYPHQVAQPTSERLWGNLTLSRHPVLSSETLPGPGVPAQQRIVIEYQEYPLAIYNVHLALPLGDPRIAELPTHFVIQTALRYNPSARNAEIERLLARLQTETYPYLVGGDFNMSPSAAIYTDIASMMSDTYRERGTGIGGTWPMPVVSELPAHFSPLLRVDYVWHSAHLQAVAALRGPALGSDHLPLWAEFTLSKTEFSNRF